MSSDGTLSYSRSLTVVSAAIILYVVAGAYEACTDVTIRLILTDLRLERPYILIVAVWVAFAWYLFRYWQYHPLQQSRRLFFETFQTALKRKNWVRSLYVRYCRDRWSADRGELPPSFDGLVLHRIRWERGWPVSGFDANGPLQGAAPLALSDLQKTRLRRASDLRALVAEPAILHFWFPYLFALVALFLGVLDLVALPEPDPQQCRTFTIGV
jgi:hypothetical protein